MVQNLGHQAKNSAGRLGVAPSDAPSRSSGCIISSGSGSPHRPSIPYPACHGPSARFTHVIPEVSSERQVAEGYDSFTPNSGTEALPRSMTASPSSGEAPTTTVPPMRPLKSEPAGMGPTAERNPYRPVLTGREHDSNCRRSALPGRRRWRDWSSGWCPLQKPCGSDSMWAAGRSEKWSAHMVGDKTLRRDEMQNESSKWPHRGGFQVRNRGHQELPWWRGLEPTRRSPLLAPLHLACMPSAVERVAFKQNQRRPLPKQSMKYGKLAKLSAKTSCWSALA